MAGWNQREQYHLQITLEKHFELLAAESAEIRELYSLWVLFQKRIEDELLRSRSVFFNYSLHDGSHSRSILQAIERFLGEDRICRLSPTDTFMILVCTYAHDYGMAQSFNKIYNILGSPQFDTFLYEMRKNVDSLEKEDVWAINNLLDYLNDEKTHIPLNDMYFSIMLVMQLYLRPIHWKGVLDLRGDFQGLFLGQIKKRFIYGSEGIVEICMCHGLQMKEMFRLSKLADGMVGDDYHPRFVAAMLRLGDLLDLDNGRFPSWLIHEIGQNRKLLPKLSLLHYRKHEAVSHLLITPEKIEITAQCRHRDAGGYGNPEGLGDAIDLEKAQMESYEVASLVSEWAEWLTVECNQLVMHWNSIVQPDFGNPPSDVRVKIYVDGKEYTAENRTFQMQMSQERVMNLLEGTSIYRDQYVGIREMIQNAVDASLLQLWSDLIQNRYSSIGLSKDAVSQGLDLLDLYDLQKASVFKNYDITVEVIEDRQWGQVFIIVKDKGIGITDEEIKYISDIGSSKEKNKKLRAFMDAMPVWLRPSGVFGIGLQSVFQLTDRIDFYTRQQNMPERQITLHSYGKNRGKIEVRELPESTDGVYNDNGVPGTNVKIAVDPRKFLEGRDKRKSRLRYFDPEFDDADVLDMIYAEVSQACREKIAECTNDYFNVYIEVKKIEKDGTTIYDLGHVYKPNRDESDERDEKLIRQIRESKNKEQIRRCLRYSFLYPPKDAQIRFGQCITRLPYQPNEGYCFENINAFYWDRKASRCYRLSIRPCKIVTEDGVNQLILPKKLQNLYSISYKFNPISNAESIYSHLNNSKRLHAGFLKLDVLILDDKPMNYMNIDRDRLRDEAIDEEELLSVRGEILEKWCEYFRKQKFYGENGRENTSFNDAPEYFFSLALLFYQNVPSDDFRKFLIPFQKLVERVNPMLKGETIKAAQLWDPESIFRVGIPLSGGIQETTQSTDETAALRGTELSMKNVSLLPHRLVHIKQICMRGNTLWYIFRLGQSDKQLAAIQMDDDARVQDYVRAFDPYHPSGKKVDYASLIKKVFKPDALYDELLLPCYPRTFRRGRNMETDMDYCIGWYLLSPFDNGSLKKLRQGIEDGSIKQEEWVNFVVGRKQFNKCVSYLMHKKYMSCSKRDEMEEIIRKKYIKFLTNFIQLLMTHKQVLIGQFEEGGTQR